MGPVRKMPVMFAVTVTGSYSCSTQRAAMVPAHEGKSWIFFGIIADNLDRVLDSSGTADIKVHPALFAEGFFNILGYFFGKQDFFFM